MAGKHYSTEEIQHIVESKNAGQSWEDIVKSCAEKFSVVRTSRVLKIVYNRAVEKEVTPSKPADSDKEDSSTSVKEIETVPEE